MNNILSFTNMRYYFPFNITEYQHLKLTANDSRSITLCSQIYIMIYANSLIKSTYFSNLENDLVLKEMKFLF